MTKVYYGTKKITAWPEDKDGRQGYSVRYADGYTSWSPKDVFEEAYQPIDAMSFGHAIVALKACERVARQGWNGKGMFLFLMPGCSLAVVTMPELAGVYPPGTMIDYHAHIDMKTAQGYVVPWLASQADMLADDWTLVT